MTLGQRTDNTNYSSPLDTSAVSWFMQEYYDYDLDFPYEFEDPMMAMYGMEGDK
jgi:hypothetical protein